MPLAGATGAAHLIPGKIKAGYYYASDNLNASISEVMLQSCLYKAPGMLPSDP